MRKLGVVFRGLSTNYNKRRPQPNAFGVNPGGHTVCAIGTACAGKIPEILTDTGDLRSTRKRFARIVPRCYSLRLGFTEFCLASLVSAAGRWVFAWRWAPHPLRIVELIVRQGLLPVAAGLTIGLAAAAASARLLKTLLFEMSPNDRLVYGSATALLILIAIAAMAVPVRRAATVDPVIALREE